MRFKTGSKVEVMCKNEVPVSWRSANIISGNGHTYSVKYGRSRGSESEDFVERVSRKAIRPCPPPVVGVQHCVVGDFVEVFDNVSWKAATVLKALDCDHLSVRLDGIPQKLRVHKSNIRIRQSWQDDKWVVVGKNLRRDEDTKYNKLPAKVYLNGALPTLQAKTIVKLGAENDCFRDRDDERLPKSTRPLKRASPYCSSVCGSSTGNTAKRRAIEKEGLHQGSAPVPLRNKVDAVAYPRETLGETYMHSSYKSNRQYNLERTRLNPLSGFSLARRSEPNDSDSDECSSVGSCSITSEIPNKSIPYEVTDTLCSAGLEDQENCHFPQEEEVAASIHRLELDAYHRTVEAFYASGTLSWEQEALLTNLRIMLHISNDEHLVEIRKLISSGSGIHTS